MVLETKIWALGFAEISCSTNVSFLSAFCGSLACTAVSTLGRAGPPQSLTRSQRVSLAHRSPWTMSSQPSKSTDFIQLNPGQALCWAKAVKTLSALVELNPLDPKRGQ